MRSAYIYVVNCDLGLIVSAFTVKHELETWLHDHRDDYKNANVYRVRAIDQQVTHMETL
jgi:hypothetical protein